MPHIMFMHSYQSEFARNLKHEGVRVGEIIAYLREQVPKGAAELKAQQVPVVSPEVEPDGPIGTFPVSKARRRG